MRNSPIRTRAGKNYWPHIHLFADRSKQSVVSMVSSPAVVDFPDRNYRYKSVATQFLHGAGLKDFILRLKIPPEIEPAPHPVVQVQNNTY